MLYVYDADKYVNNGDKVINDCESAFYNVDLTKGDIEYTNKVLGIIDGAKINNSKTVIDRFGRVIPSEFISTGAKAAILAGYFKNHIIDLIECGNNARDVIVNYCKEGSIIIYDVGNSISIENIDDNNDINFTKLDEFNYYLDRY